MQKSKALFEGELWRELGKETARKPKGTQCFVTWRNVDAGAVAWKNSDGMPASCWDAPPAVTRGASGPYGVRIEAVPGQIIGPVFPMDRPWERNYNMYFDTVLYENGLYRAWYTCVPQDYADPETGKMRTAHGHIVCYAESADAVTWEKPELGLCTYDGQPSNIVYGRALAPYGFQSGSIFVDPHAPAEERYKMFFLGVLDYDEPVEAVMRRYAERFGRAINPKIFSGRNGRTTVKCMCGAVSEDGIHWKTLPEPILAESSDTLNTCRWDEARGKYVAYIRLWRNGRRVVGRAESEDFSCWREKSTVVLDADLNWPGYMDVYTNSRVNYPDSDEQLMFPGVYHRWEDRREVYMAATQDGERWNWVPNSRVAGCGETGQWTAGDLNPGTGMVFLPGDLAAIPVMVSEEPHKYPRKSNASLGKPAWLTWKKGRIGCIRADETGEFTTLSMVCTGDRLVLNYETVPRSGQLLAALQDEDGTPLEGFTFAEADALCGNSLGQCAAWRGKTDLSQLKGRIIRIQFRMRAAKLYAFEFTEETHN